MNDYTDRVLAAIDSTVQAVTVERCAFCDTRMPSGRFSGSLYFCQEDCQALWHATHLDRGPDPAVSWADAEREARRARIRAAGAPYPLPDVTALPAANHNALAARPCQDTSAAGTRRRRDGRGWFDDAVEAVIVPGVAVASDSTPARVWWLPDDPEEFRDAVPARRDQLAGRWEISNWALDHHERTLLWQPLVESSMRALASVAPALREMTDYFRAAGGAAVELVCSEPDAFGVDPAQLDVQQEGAGSAPMQQAIRAKRHRGQGPQSQGRKDRHRRQRPCGEWFQL